MHRPTAWIAALVATLVVAASAYVIHLREIANPRIVQTLEAEPDGAVAHRVMLLRFPDGHSIPVNYLREGRYVYAGADGPWWRRLRDGPVAVEVLIRGETLAGQALAVTDDPARTAEVFSKLRPTVPRWLPDWLNGVLVVIEITAPDATSPNPA